MQSRARLSISWLSRKKGQPTKDLWKFQFGKKLCFALPSLYPHYIYPHYPQIVRNAFQKENPSKYTWEVFLNSYHSISRSLRGCLLKHLSYPFWVLSENLVLMESIGRSHSLADAIRLNCKIQKAKEDKTLRSPLVAGAWRAQVHGVD